VRRQLRDIVLDDEKLCELAVAARLNALNLLTDSSVLLEAHRYGRAHALAVLALEELGKVTLCLEGLFGSMSNRQVLAAWGNHFEKLMRGHQLALLYADYYPAKDVVDRLREAVRSDAAVKLQGFYVDPTPSGISRPSTVSHDEAAGLVELVRDVLTVVAEMNLAGASEVYRAQDAVEVRRTMGEIERVLADSASQFEQLPFDEREAAERRLAAALDNFVREFRAAQPAPSVGLAEDADATSRADTT